MVYPKVYKDYLAYPIMCVILAFTEIEFDYEKDFRLSLLDSPDHRPKSPSPPPASSSSSSSDSKEVSPPGAANSKGHLPYSFSRPSQHASRSEKGAAANNRQIDGMPSRVGADEKEDVSKEAEPVQSEGGERKEQGRKQRSESQSKWIYTYRQC